MDHWARDSIRASILCDLNEFVPVNYFEGVTSGMSQGKADCNLSMKLRTDLSLNMNGRQRKASDVLLYIAILESTESALNTCKTGKEKKSLRHLQLEGELNQLRENLKNENCNPIDTSEKMTSISKNIEECIKDVQAIDITEKTLESGLTTAIPDFCKTLQEYVQYLPDNEARPILYFLENNVKQEPAAKVETTEQAATKLENKAAITTHKLKKRNMPLDAEIAIAKSNALDKTNVQSIWDELVKMANKQEGCLIGEGDLNELQYGSRQEPQIFTRKQLGDRIKRA